MNPQKLAFLTSLMNETQGQSKNSLLPFLMAAAGKAKDNDMTFTDEETDLFYQQMKKNLKPEDQARVQMLYQAIRKNR